MARSSAFSNRRSRQMPVVRSRWMLDSLTRNWTVPTNALPPVTIVNGTATPAAITLTAVTPAPTIKIVVFPAAIALTAATAAPLPAAWPISETFTGTNGDPWYAGRWNAGAGQAPTIVGNRGDFTSATGLGDVEYAALKPALLANQGGRLDIRFDNFIVDTNSAIYVVIGNDPIASYSLLVATDGSIFDLGGVTSGDIGVVGPALVVSDTLHHHVVRDSATGYLAWTWWLNAATEPTTPNIQTIDTAVTDVNFVWIGRFQDDVNSVRYDNLTIVAPKAFPADIAISPDFGTLLVPAPAAKGGSNTTPAAITRTVVTPAPTATGVSNGTATPTAITLTAVTSAPTTTGSSNTTPTAVALTMTTPAPTVTGTANTTPAAIARTVVTAAPTAGGSSNTTPAAIARLTVTPAPTTTGGTGASTSPAAITLTAVTSAPTATGNSNTTPAAIARIAVTSAPTASGSSNTTPTAIALTVVVPAPTTTGTASTTSTAIALTAATEEPTTTGDARAPPDVIELVAALPSAEASGTDGNGYAFPDDLTIRARVSEGTTHTFTDDWTGTDGDPWDPAIWPFTFSFMATQEIQSNHGRIVVDPTGISIASTTSFVPVIPSRGSWDFYTEFTVADIDGGGDEGSIISRFQGTGFRFRPAIAEILVDDGTDGSWIDTFVIADGDTVKVRMVTTGASPWTTDLYAWISGPQPGTPLHSWPTVDDIATDPNITVFTTDTAPGPWTIDWDNFSATYWDLLATITGGANVFPTAVALPAVTPAPTATGETGSTNGTATPTAIALIATTSAPTVTGQGVAFPTAIALSATTPAPTASGAAAGQATPSTIALTTTITTPTTSGQGVASPATIARTVVLSAPTATGGADGTASPTAITVAATVTTPTATGAANTTPAAIALTVVVPAPQATGASAGQASPAAVMLSVVLGAVTVSGGGTATPPTTGLAAATDAPDATGTVVYFPYWGARVG